MNLFNFGRRSALKAFLFGTRYEFIMDWNSEFCKGYAKEMRRIGIMYAGK